MRELALVGTALLAACTTSPAHPQDNAGAPQSAPVHGVTTGHQCKVAGAERFIGRPSNSETGSAIKRATNAAVLRWASPGYMLTMDFREDRVTVYLSPDRRVTKISCG